MTTSSSELMVLNFLVKTEESLTLSISTFFVAVFLNRHLKIPQQFELLFLIRAIPCFFSETSKIKSLIVSESLTTAAF